LNPAFARTEGNLFEGNDSVQVTADFPLEGNDSEGE
jgi:hypothetical protein